ncbi:alpha-(1,3)-fucosyltransferase c [Plakobranchus ocellatus]|uniref:Fucosyltransferase n=1 Tax=Plakobranchus ocellatus TaxID=259542 RepID=A0AAV3XVV1_9GAST|nr:alpha-(1,3)-fucosyltransferase c [Plakobranchus ocellatus]
MLPTVKGKHIFLVLLLTLTLLWICILHAHSYFKQRIPANENPFPYARDRRKDTEIYNSTFSKNGEGNDEEKSKSEELSSQAKQERTKPERNLIVEPEFNNSSLSRDETSKNGKDDEQGNGGVIDSKDSMGTTRKNEPERDKPPIQTPTPDRVYRIFDHNPISSHRHADYYKFSECPYSKCAFTNNSRKADLLMVNAARIKNYPLPERRKGALLMMYTKEPPTFKRFRFLNSTDYMGSVNWTRTVYPGSTFMAHYNDIIQRDPPTDKDYEAIFNRKRKEAAWFVTHCNTHSKREEYIKRMSRELRVDIYGACGKKSCGKYGFEMGGQRDVCLDLLRRDYKFYMSFENTMCTGYITEKFFNMYDDVDIIPVVRGGGEYRCVSQYICMYVDVNAYCSQMR